MLFFRYSVGMVMPLLIINHTRMQSPFFDILIVGSGAAGLSAALDLAQTNQVAIISKSDFNANASFWAQGGVAAVLSDSDSFDSHIQDTLIAGAGLCDEDAVRLCVEQAPNAIQWLHGLGVPLTLDNTQQSSFHLTREGGHSHRRIVHADDATGKAIHTTLFEQVERHPNITLLNHHMAIDLIVENLTTGRRVVGLYVFDTTTESIITYGCHSLILATGGASKVYTYTTNPAVASGDGIAMAWRAGCRIQDMEFNQFHPTCLYHPKAQSFLLTEAIRGEGGVLRLPNGERFMHQFDDRAELAPRDIVARAIDYEMKRLGADCLYLDISHQPAEFIRNRFPTLYEQCLGFGFDMTTTPIPIVPAAHYTCGGVKTNLQGQTDIPNLYAIGEVACTGLHGANRMASNSLLECFVFAKRAAADILAQGWSSPAEHPLPSWDESQVCDPDEKIVIAHNWEELRRFMWDYVGIVRTTKRLLRAQNRIHLLQQEIQDFYAQFKVNADLLELRNLVTVADLIVQSALLRKESRGLHCTLDYPQLEPGTAKHTILSRPLT